MSNMETKFKFSLEGMRGMNVKRVEPENRNEINKVSILFRNRELNRILTKICERTNRAYKLLYRKQEG